MFPEKNTLIQFTKNSKNKKPNFQIKVTFRVPLRLYFKVFYIHNLKMVF